ncbi:MAG TPA: EAL domain-containing protein [Pseudolabrys sp.]|nr:EAL domain-containing protein [Pseudolabrys sp.]
MLRLLSHRGRYRDLKKIVAAGVLWFGLTLGVMEALSTYVVSIGTLSVLLAAIVGALTAVCTVGFASGLRVRRKLSERNKQIDAAINNMVQGLCMFDAQNRLVVWNERYRSMYSIDPGRIWRGCTIRDLLDARIKAGTFPLDPGRYDSDLRAALTQGKTFTLTVALADGRVIAVVNQPMAGGGWIATHEDITEAKRAEQELEQTRSFLDTILENVPSPIIVKDVESRRYLLINRAAETYLGIDRKVMLGKRAIDVMPAETAEHIDAEDQRLVDTQKQLFIGEHAIVTPANGTRIVTTTRLPVMGVDGKPQYLISVVHDVTDRKLNEQRIAHMAHHDPLTELPNRTAFNECITKTIDLAGKSDESFAVMCLDLDRFKTVNDVFGHSTGDRLLKEVAQRLAAACEGAFLARVGGDEFTVITPAGDQPQAAELLAERLCAALDSDIEIDGNAVRVGLTIGIAVFPQDGEDVLTLLANADAALFRAKSEARGSVRFFESAMDTQLREKRLLQQDLRNAIARDELALHYQPQAHISGEITGFEALVRWHHPRFGMVAPSTFIPLAEETGIIVSLGEWILRTACREAASWPKALRVAVNLSPVQFQRGDLVKVVHEILLETGLSPTRLELEITEGVLIRDFSGAVATLRRLKGLGVRIAMDDFGTGYSSLSYLQSFPFDKIKIDRAFVANLAHSQQAVTIIRAVIALGRGLNLPVVAEGVETEGQLKFLAAENCSEIQGYLVGRPQPIEDYADAVGRKPVVVPHPHATRAKAS